MVREVGSWVELKEGEARKEKEEEGLARSSCQTVVTLPANVDHGFIFLSSSQGTLFNRIYTSESQELTFGFIFAEPSLIVSIVHSSHPYYLPPSHRWSHPLSSFRFFLLLHNVSLRSQLRFSLSRLTIPFVLMEKLRLKKSPVQETLTASVSSLLAGVGVVALFCAVGVNV